MLFDINNSFSYPINLTFVRKLLKKICLSIDFPRNCKISIAFVNNKTIKKLNKVYRKKDKVTSILSFAESDTKKNFVTRQKKSNYLGEIVISYPQVAKNATKGKRTIKGELGMLLTHGLLHLAGYCHKTNKEAIRMERIERNALKMLDGI